jgi:hypothetical protein
LDSKLYIKLVAFPFNTEFANENALFACLFAFLIHVAALEFFFECDARFLGTAIFDLVFYQFILTNIRKKIKINFCVRRRLV